MTRPTAILYVDGFNLYRRCLADHPDVKWLDLIALAENLMPFAKIIKVHYFTARIKPGASQDRRAPLRQQIYLRALDTFAPKLEVHLGQFRIDKRWMIQHPVEVDPETGNLKRVAVKKVEEKGSDVNLAVRMVSDAHLGRADLYVMLTNDSDQAGTLRTVAAEASGVTGLILPMDSARGSKELVKVPPGFVGFVTRPILEQSQLPPVLSDNVGTIVRPASWSSDVPKAPGEPGAF